MTADPRPHDDDCAPMPGDRAALDWRDYGILRRRWHNFAELAPGVYRSNQPSPERLALWARDLKLASVLNLRGRRPHEPFWRLEQAECARLGLQLIDAKLHARKAARAEEYLAAIRAMRDAPRPLLIHCKSGADRAGMAAALFRLAIEGQPVAQARRELSLRRLHLKSSATGILDHTLDHYARCEDAMGIEQWLGEVYDPAAVTASFRGRAA